MCDNQELLVSYVYDELTATERRAFDAHMAVCTDCRQEVAGLRSTRLDLESWAPPDPGFGFHIARNSAPPIASARARLSPMWGLAAAAVLVLAAASAIANVEVRYGAEGLVLRTGWNQDHAGGPASTTAASIGTVDWQREAQALEGRVRQLETSVAAREVSAPVQPDAVGADLLRRVGHLVKQSESRQQRAMAERMEELTRQIDARRKVDLALVDQAVMRLQSTSGAEIRQSRDLMQRMYRATAFQPK
jgi:anti-sigma factor RsiW